MTIQLHLVEYENTVYSSGILNVHIYFIKIKEIIKISIYPHKHRQEGQRGTNNY